MTITELVRLIGEIAGRSPAVASNAAQPEGDLVADIGRLREVLGVAPAIPPADGLRGAIALALQSAR